MARFPSEFDVPEESPGFLLWKITTTWQRLIKNSLEPYGVSHAQFVILAISLWYEKNNQTLSQNILIQQSKLDKMTVSKSLQILGSNGYVSRSEHKQDARAKSVLLTKKGKALAAKLVPLVEKVDKEFFAALKNVEQNKLMELLGKLVCNLDGF